MGDQPTGAGVTPDGGRGSATAPSAQGWPRRGRRTGRATPTASGPRRRPSRPGSRRRRSAPAPAPGRPAPRRPPSRVAPAHRYGEHRHHVAAAPEDRGRAGLRRAARGCRDGRHRRDERVGRRGGDVGHRHRGVAGSPRAVPPSRAWPRRPAPAVKAETVRTTCGLRDRVDAGAGEDGVGRRTSARGVERGAARPRDRTGGDPAGRGGRAEDGGDGLLRRRRRERDLVDRGCRGGGRARGDRLLPREQRDAEQR